MISFVVSPIIGELQSNFYELPWLCVLLVLLSQERCRFGEGMYMAPDNIWPDYATGIGAYVKADGI